MRPLDNLHRAYADRVTVLGVLSWTRGNQVAISRGHASRFKTTFPMWHDGPVTAMTTWSPTTVIFDKSGVAIAWARGDYYFSNPALPTLLDALAR